MVINGGAFVLPFIHDFTPQVGDRAAMAATNRSVTTSATSSCTMNRLPAIQDWPAFCTRACTATDTARSRSADGRTMNGSLPPSSRTTFLPTAPAWAATARPAPTLPVSVTAATRRSAMTAGTWSVPINSVWRTPSGAPARRIRSSRRSAVRGTLGACLRRPTLPAITAGARNRATCHRGKFHGMMASTTPSGW